MKRRRLKSRIRRKRVQQESLHLLPRTIDLQRAIQSGHYTPDTVLALQQVAGNQATIQRAPNGAAPPTATQSQSEAEKRLKEIIASLKPEKKNDGKTDSEQYKKALISALKAFMKTDLGKQIKAKALNKALSAEGLPLTILLGSGAIAGLFATNAGIPGIPDIPLTDNLSLSLELEGSMQNPTGIKFAFKYTFGGDAKPEKKSPTADPTKLSPDMLKAIQGLDKQLFSKWILERAYWEYETAGPDDEQAKHERYKELKAGADGLPDAHMVGEALAQLLVEKAGEKRIEFDLTHGDLWDSFITLKGLINILNTVLETVVPHLPASAQEVEQVTFKVGKKLYPLRVKKEE